MNPTIPPAPPPEGSQRTPVPKRRPWLLYGCGLLLGLLMIIFATVAITVWYIQRPIKPVVLSATEKAAVDKKLEHLDGASRGAQLAPNAKGQGTQPEADRHYVPGSKELRLTERELNGLLNENTDLGKTLRFEFGRDAINAYVTAPIPQDVPVLSGKMFRARGRFRVSLVNGAAPYAILEDVTVFGLSLPKAWLGGLKGENLLADAMANTMERRFCKASKVCASNRARWCWKWLIEPARIGSGTTNLRRSRRFARPFSSPVMCFCDHPTNSKIFPGSARRSSTRSRRGIGVEKKIDSTIKEDTMLVTRLNGLR